VLEIQRVLDLYRLMVAKIFALCKLKLKIAEVREDFGPFFEVERGRITDGDD